jgi:hypothetical protein
VIGHRGPYPLDGEKGTHPAIVRVARGESQGHDDGGGNPQCDDSRPEGFVVGDEQVENCSLVNGSCMAVGRTSIPKRGTLHASVEQRAFRAGEGTPGCKGKESSGGEEFSAVTPCDGPAHQE